MTVSYYETYLELNTKSFGEPIARVIDGIDFEIFNFQVETQPVNVIPLLPRIISRVIRHITVLGNFQLENFLHLDPCLSIPKNRDKISLAYLYEEVLRLFVLFSQIKAKMWTRNGVSPTVGLRNFYISSHLYSTVSYYNDLFLAQTIACRSVERLDQFLLVTADRFQVHDYFTLHGDTFNLKKGSQEECVVLEGFLSLLLSLITDRTLLTPPSLLPSLLRYFPYVLLLIFTYLLSTVNYLCYKLPSCYLFSFSSDM